MAEEKRDIKVRLPNEIKGGVYANNMNILHTPEEFIWNARKPRGFKLGDEWHPEQSLRS